MNWSAWLTPEDRAWSQDVTQLWLGNVKNYKLGPPLHPDKRGEPWMKGLGALGQAAFHRIVGAPLPSAIVEGSKFTHGADALGRFEIRTITARHYRLPLHDPDARHVGRIFVTIFIEGDGCAIVKWAPFAEAWAAKKWAGYLETPCYLVNQVKMRDPDDDLAREVAEAIAVMQERRQ